MPFPRRLAHLAAALAGVLIATDAGAETSSGPCVAATEGIAVCGHGTNPLVVLEGTTSPTARLAIAWRTKGEPQGEFPDAADVENHLVRLADGQSLALVVGRAWNNGKGRGNHIYQSVAWSPDGRWLIVGDGGKWSLEAIAVYAIDEKSGKVSSRGLFVDLRDAATGALEKRIGRSKAAAYYFDLRGDGKLEITNNGRISIPILFQIPKQDGSFEGVVRVKASRRGNSVGRTRFGVMLAKGRT